jgi:hypothetical protein
LRAFFNSLILDFGSLICYGLAARLYLDRAKYFPSERPSKARRMTMALTGGNTVNGIPLNTAGTVLLTVVVTLAVVAIAAIVAHVTNRALLRRDDRDLRQRLAQLESIVRQKHRPENINAQEVEVLVGRLRFWAWTLAGLVLGAVAGFVVQYYWNPLPAYRGVPLWGEVERYSFHGLIWFAVGVAVLAVFAAIGSRYQRVKLLAPVSASESAAVLPARSDARGGSS